MKLENSLVLVTGAGNGIGRDLCIALSEKKAVVIGVDVDAKALAATQKILQEKEKSFLGFVCDLSDEKSVQVLLSKLKKLPKYPDVLINNAGIAPGGPIESRDYSEWKKCLSTNINGTIQLTLGMLPHFQKRNSGHIVNLASIAGKMGSEGVVIYSATKHAIVGFSSGLRYELKRWNIGVSWICPSMVATRMIDGVKPSFWTPIVEPKQVTKAILSAIEKNKSEVFVPWFLKYTITILPTLSMDFALWFARKTNASIGWYNAKNKVR